MLCTLYGCVGSASKGVFGTGVTIALDPRSLGTQIDDSIMQKNLITRLTLKEKSYFLSIKTQVLDGHIILTGNVNNLERMHRLARQICLARKKLKGLNLPVCLIFPAFLMISAPRSMKKPMAFSWKSGCHCKRCLAVFLMWGRFLIKWPKICGFAKRVLPDKHQPKAAPRPLIQQAINRLPSIRPPLWPLSANFPTG